MTRPSSGFPVLDAGCIRWPRLSDASKGSRATRWLRKATTPGCPGEQGTRLLCQTINKISAKSTLLAAPRAHPQLQKSRGTKGLASRPGSGSTNLVSGCRETSRRPCRSSEVLEHQQDKDQLRTRQRRSRKDKTTQTTEPNVEKLRKGQGREGTSSSGFVL